MYESLPAVRYCSVSFTRWTLVTFVRYSASKLRIFLYHATIHTTSNNAVVFCPRSLTAIAVIVANRKQHCLAYTFAYIARLYRYVLSMLFFLDLRTIDASILMPSWRSRRARPIQCQILHATFIRAYVCPICHT